MTLSVKQVYTDVDIEKCFPVMSQLRPQLVAAEFTSQVRSQMQQGYRLACQTYPKSDLKLHVPSESLSAPQCTQIESLEVDIDPDPSSVEWKRT